ncbi:hypothetical protein IKI14_00315 [bacterium]|nr:hypothetical protein [bacterium]
MNLGDHLVNELILVEIILNLNDLDYDQYFLDDEFYLKSDDEVVVEVLKVGSFLY